jgi:hypothetical protein
MRLNRRLDMNKIWTTSGVRMQSKFVLLEEVILFLCCTLPRTLFILIARCCFSSFSPAHFHEFRLTGPCRVTCVCWHQMPRNLFTSAWCHVTCVCRHQMPRNLFTSAWCRVTCVFVGIRCRVFCLPGMVPRNLFSPWRITSLPWRRTA